MRRVTPAPLSRLCQLVALQASIAGAALFGACSGGASEGSGASRGEQEAPAGQGAASSAPASPPAQSPEDQLRAAQDSAVEAMCERLVECAVESARASMSHEEVAQLDLDKTVPRLRDECEDEGGKSAMSPRQVRVVQRCVNQAADCGALNTCLDDARKK